MRSDGLDARITVLLDDPRKKGAGEGTGRWGGTGGPDGPEAVSRLAGLSTKLRVYGSHVGTVLKLLLRSESPMA